MAGGFASIQEIRNAIMTGGKVQDFTFTNKTPTTPATTFVTSPTELFTATGSPAAISFSGTAGVATALTNATTGALVPLVEGNVSTDKRFLLDFSIWNDASSANFPYPGWAMLLDLVLYYPNCSTASATTLNNTVTLPRYTDGKGLVVFSRGRASVIGSPQLNLTFTDSSNNSKTMAIINSGPASTIRTTNFSPSYWGFLNELPSGVVGVKKIDSYTLTGAVGGSACDLIIAKPLALVPILQRRNLVNKNFVQPFLSMPQIYDGACLGVMLLAADIYDASACTFHGNVRYGWF